MARSNVRQPNITPDLERIELARQALHQIEALLPMAQRMADSGEGEPDAMLGLLGRIDQMNEVAMSLLTEVVDTDSQSEGSVLRSRLAVLGRKEASNG
jgi:hypothetical protein